MEKAELKEKDRLKEEARKVSIELFSVTTIETLVFSKNGWNRISKLC
jgi:hypothetical protein